MVRSEGNMSLKNPVTPPGIDPGTVRLVSQRLNHYATPGPLLFYAICFYCKHERRLEENLTHSACIFNINAEWQTLKNTLQQAANEALGKRKKRRHKRHLIL